MKVGIYISELLHDHDTVILPGFGEFYTRYKPAKFLPEEGRIESPSKTIAFNPDKRQGDTPLVDLLCKKQNMQEEEVTKYLEDLVGEIFQLLESGKKVALENVGVFSSDQDGTLSFDPDTGINYLDEATGIGSLQEPPKKPAVVITSSSGIREEESQKEHEDLTMEKEKKQKLPPALRWIAFTVVPLLLIILILALNYRYFFGGSSIKSLHSI